MKALQSILFVVLSSCTIQFYYLVVLSSCTIQLYYLVAPSSGIIKQFCLKVGLINITLSNVLNTADDKTKSMMNSENKFWECRELNQGQLSEKRKCYLSARPFSIPLCNTIFYWSRLPSCQQHRPFCLQHLSIQLLNTKMAADINSQVS